MNKKFLLLVMCTFSSYASQNQPIYRTENEKMISYSSTKSSIGHNGQMVNVVATFLKQDGRYSKGEWISSDDLPYDVTTEENDAELIFQLLERGWREQQSSECRKQTS